MNDQPSEIAFKYFAFISYTHPDNRDRRENDPPNIPKRMRWADWLHNALETYRVPRPFVGKSNKRGQLIPARLVPCFRDELELPTEARLQSAIEDALRQSRYLVVICSPRSALSVYVNAEVAFFKRLGRADCILPLIVAGEPNAALTGDKYGFKPEDECFCPALKHPLRADGTLDESLDEDPLCADTRWGEARRELAAGEHRIARATLETALLKLIAGLLGVGFDELIQRERQRQIRARRRRAIVIASVMGVIVTFASIAWWQRGLAVIARNEEHRQRENATNALQRASARLLTLQARDEAKQSIPRTLLLSAAAVEATASQQYVEPATEEFLRDTLSQVRGVPMATSKGDELPMLNGISPDRFWALTSGLGRQPTLWRFSGTGDVEQKITLDTVQSYDALRFSPNSKFLIWAQSPLTARLPDGSSNGHFTLIPLSSADQQGTYARMAIQNLSESIESIRFSPNGRLVLLLMDYPEDRPVHLYQLAEDGSAIRELKIPLPQDKGNPAREWKFHPNGSWLVAVQRAKQSLAWRLLEDHVEGPYELNSPGDSGDRFADFSSDGKWLVTFGYSPIAKLWNLTGDVPARVSFDLATGGERHVETAQFSPDGKWLVTPPCLWRLDVPDPSASPIRLPLPELRSQDVIDYTSDSRRLVVLQTITGMNISVWDLTAANPLASPLKIEGSFEISGDRRWVMETPVGSPGKIRDLCAGPIAAGKAVDIPGPPVRKAVFSHDSTTVATAHTDGSIRVHSLVSQDSIRTVVARESGVPPDRLKFSPKDGWLLTQCSSNSSGFEKSDSPTLFQLRKGAPPPMTRLDQTAFQFFQRDDKEVTTGDPSATEFEFSPGDDGLIARQTSSWIGYMWDLRSDQVAESRQLLKGHEYRISYFDFVAGGRLITSELYDGSGLLPHCKRPRLWEAGERLAKQPDPFVRWAEFNRKGDILATIGGKGTLVLNRPREDGTLQALLTAPDMGGGVVNRRSVGGYAPQQRPQFLPGFDNTGRWFLAASAVGRLSAVDCSPPLPKVHQIATDLGENLFVAVDGQKSLLVTGAPGEPSQLEAWDLSGQEPKPRGKLDVDWAANLYSSDPPKISVAFLSTDRIAISAPAKAAGKAQVWSYSLPDGARTMLAEVTTDKAINTAADGSVVAGSDGVYDLRKRATYRLDGFVAAPQISSSTETRFEYCLSPNGRWAVGRRYTIEGYAEFGRKSSYSWRQLFDLASPDPRQAVIALPEVERSIFADFSGDSSHWVSVSAEGKVVIVSLPPQRAPQVMSKKIDQFFSGQAGGTFLWPTAGVSYEVSLSPRGDWLATRRGDLCYLIRLQEPFEGRLLRGFQAEQGLFSSVTTLFSPNEDFAIIGTRFWRARTEANLLSAVNLGDEILTASGDGKWLVTSRMSAILLHPVNPMELIRRARSLAGRELTSDEEEEFQLQPGIPKK